MLFLVFLLFGCGILALEKKGDSSINLLLNLIFIIIWTLFVGSQYNVGTDYFSYRSIFNNPENYPVDKTHEYLFYRLINWSLRTFKDPNLPFFIIALISSSTFILFIQQSIKKNSQWLYLFLFIIVGTCFNNQFNAIRQYLAIYFITLSTIFLIKKKYIFYVIFLILSTTTHSSSYIAAFCFIAIIISSKYIKNKLLISILLVSGIIPLLGNFIPQVEEIMSMIGTTHYIGNHYLKGLENKDLILKYIYAIITLLAIVNRRKMKLTAFEDNLFTIGSLAFCFKIVCLVSTVTNRFGMFFEPLMLFPILYFLEYLSTKKPIYYISILMLFFIIYFIKVTFLASQEYIYNSIFLI